MYSKNITKYLLIFLFILNLPFFANFTKAENTETPIEIANPVFTTKGINEMPYTIKAALGIQQGENLIGCPFEIEFAAAEVEFAELDKEMWNRRKGQAEYELQVFLDYVKDKGLTKQDLLDAVEWDEEDEETQSMEE